MEVTGVEHQPLVYSWGRAMGRAGLPRWTEHLCGCRFVSAVLCGLPFRALIACRCQSEVANVLKLQHLIAPAGPSWLKTSGKQLQTPGFSSNIRPQYLCEKEAWRKRNDHDWVNIFKVCGMCTVTPQKPAIYTWQQKKTTAWGLVVLNYKVLKEFTESKQRLV